MKGILVFNQINELVYLKWDEELDEKFADLFKRHSMTSDDENDRQFYISQLFSPILISQKIMGAQFANIYKSIQCENKVNLVLSEWLDYNILIVGNMDVESLNCHMADFKTILQHLFGQNHGLILSKTFANWMDMLTDNIERGDYIPGACGFIDSGEITLEALKSLKLSNIWFKNSKHQRYHALIVTGDKVLALYSSKTAVDLLPADLLLMTIQSKAANHYWNSIDNENNHGIALPWLTIENSAIINLCIEYNGSIIPAVPHSFHLGQIAKGVSLIFLFDIGLRDLGMHTAITVKYLSLLKTLLLQRATDTTQILDKIELHMKKVIEDLKNNKDFLDLSTKIKVRLDDLKKACNKQSTLAPESAVSALQSIFENVYEILRPPVTHLDMNDIITKVQCNLKHHMNFLIAKSENIFQTDYPIREPGDYPEFPGLLHYIHIDRSTGRYFSPELYTYKTLMSREILSKTIQRCLKALQNGCSYVCWRTNRVHVLYSIWFENVTTSARINPPRIYPSLIRQLPQVGDITGSFYKHLVDLLFPNDSQNICVKEIICLHLGLVPAAVAVQHARKLTHDICEEALIQRSGWEDLL